MPAGTTPIFAQTPVSVGVSVSATANTSRAVVSAGTPTNGVLMTPGTNTNGIRIDQITATGTGTTVAGQIVIWLYDGTNSYPLFEISVPVVTASTTAPAYQSNVIPTNLVLAPSCKLYATSTVASQLVSLMTSGGAF